MRKRVFSALAATAIVVGACGGAASPSPTSGGTPGPSGPAPTGGATPAPTGEPDYEALLFDFDYQPEEGQAGRSVVIGEWQAASNLNNFYDNSFATSEVLAATMRNLWIAGTDGERTVWKPDLAAKMPKFSDGSIRQNADGSFEMDIELRPGLKWSDGEDLTLNDLRFTWQWVMDPNQSGLVQGTTGWEDIRDIEVSSDGLSATIFFDKPYAGFYGLFAGPGYFLPEHYFADLPIPATNAMQAGPDLANVPTSGPYKFVSASPNAIELTRNEYWVGGSFDQGTYIDNVRYQFYSTKDGMIAAFKAGELDVALDMTAADYPAIQDVSPDVGEAQLSPSWLYEHLDMNQGPNGHPMLRELDVRKALYQAIDRTDLYQTLFPGNPAPEEPACSPAPPGTYWRDETLECLPYDVDAAKALLEGAGWTDSNGDGTVDKDGREAVLEACTSSGNPTRQLTLEKVAGYLEEIGIRINITLADATTVYFASWNDTTPDTKCSIYRGTYDLALFAWVLTFDLFGDYYYSYHTDQWPDEEPHDGGNTSRFSNPEMDEALDTLRDSIETADQVQAALTVQKVYVDEIAEIPLYYREEVRGVSSRLHNFVKNPSTATDMWNIEDWWVDQ